PDGIPFTIEARFPHGLLDVGVREWQRAADGEDLRVSVDTFHADLTINSDGTLSVQEETRVSVLEGALHQGVRSLSLLYIDNVGQPAVSINGEALVPGDGDCTNCFVINELPRPNN